MYELNSFHLATSLLILSGCVVLTGGILQVARLVRIIPDSVNRQHWRLLSSMVVIFLGCYLLALALILLGRLEELMLLTGFILFFGAVFVLGSATLGHHAFVKIIGGAKSELKMAQDIAQHQSHLLKSQKLEAVGQLTGGLAHDFNNLLGIVVGNLDEIHDFLPADNAVVLGQHTAALNAALRGAELARSLVAVGRRQPLDLQRHDLNAVLEEMMPLMRSSAGSAVTVRCEPTTDKLITRLDPAGLDNAALNLVINARDAMQDVKGEQVLTLRTRTEWVEVTNSGELAPGSYAVLEVSDNGPGMSEAVRLQAFDAFFTTKERDKGTGLGLAMVYGYAAQLGGTALIHSEKGVGTTVQLYLPLEQGSSETAELPEVRQAPVIDDTAASPSQLVVAKQTSVLVVDDEPELCELAAHWIASLDYVVTTAKGPVEALEYLASGEFDILFTDIVMPGGMDGIELSEIAKRRQPKLQVVLVTGYAQRLLENNDMLFPVLDKPYRKADLARVFSTL
jgi:signal transduction histidine kinase/CheY-like chemotaxis protein